jgi:hypothetical protein
MGLEEIRSHLFFEPFRLVRDKSDELEGIRK